MSFISMEDEFQMPDSVPIFGVSPFNTQFQTIFLLGYVCSTLLIRTATKLLSLQEEKDKSVGVS